MPNPLTATLAFLEQDAVNLPLGTTLGVDFPIERIEQLHVQFAWDGTPSDADNREDTAVRITVWAPDGAPTQAQDVAGGLRARFLAWCSEDVYRVNRGAGRLPGTDPDTGLPFCTFTVNPVMWATT